MPILYLRNSQGELEPIPGMIGPPGEQGIPGQDGADGAPGPNEVTAATGTNLTGLLKGNGTAITAAAAGTDYIAPPTLLTALPASETALQDNAEYRVDSAVGTYQFAFPASPHRIWLRITTSASPAITFPAGTKYGGGAPTWKASTEYEMTVVDGRVVVMEMVSA